MVMIDIYKNFTFDYSNKLIGNSVIIHADCFEWFCKIPENSIHAIVTDPPYGVKEYDFDQLEKRANGNGGIWRIPPSFDGNIRSPLPRFTALNDKERINIQRFFLEWSKIVYNALLSGGHVFIASNSFLSQLVFSSLIEGGLEYRSTVIRLVRTLRGGDRPKNAEKQFPDVCSLPRGCFEPWGLFRKPIPNGMTVSDCLKEFQTGALRRKTDGNPFEDVIESGRTPQKERNIADHPSLKPQSFLRQLTYAALPLGKGIIVDPFMGSGSTIAAAEANNYNAIGVERYEKYYEIGKETIPKLSRITTDESQLRLFAS
ncbi:MAG: site-specific DNA-methyltransferase [Desulfobacteraceae bacterium]|nr:MAG: site-specific DNA-methyltransferase [Desulfobacteraceae bacterium]